MLALRGQSLVSDEAYVVLMCRGGPVSETPVAVFLDRDLAQAHAKRKNAVWEKETRGMVGHVRPISYIVCDCPLLRASEEGAQ